MAILKSPALPARPRIWRGARAVPALAVLFELGGGLLLLVGYQTRLVACTLGVYVIVAILIAHRNWADANQLAHFWKGVTIAGGGFALAALGGGSYSIDGRRA
jgi:putative oxidoreductase